MTATYPLGDLDADGVVSTTDLEDLKGIVTSNDYSNIINLSDLVGKPVDTNITSFRALKLADTNNDNIISLIDYKNLENMNTYEDITFTNNNVIVSAILFVAGDINFDGYPTSTDANSIIANYEYYNKNPLYLAICDVNGDGVCDTTDADLITNISYEGKNVILLVENDPMKKRKYILGDVDLDGYLTYKDKDLIANSISGKVKFNGIIKEYSLADANNDTIINNSDANYVVNTVKGSTTHFYPRELYPVNALN